jgi:hypothetical protein
MTMKRGDVVDQLIAYEEGRMTDREVIRLFQQLIDSGLAWQLQGSYGRMAQELIDSGRCKREHRGSTSGGPSARRTVEEESRAR